MFSNLKRDLQTYQGRFLAQGFWAMTVYRFGRWSYGFRNPLIRKPLGLFYRLLFVVVQVLAGIELPCEVDVGEGLRFDHFGGIIISGYAKIGSHCILRNGVTIGLKNLDEPKAPVLGDYVNVGSGAKILGNIRIGNHVDIGANAVVLCDVPDHCIAVGVPARIIPKSQQSSQTSDGNFIREGAS